MIAIGTQIHPLPDHQQEGLGLVELSDLAQGLVPRGGAAV